MDGLRRLAQVGAALALGLGLAATTVQARVQPAVEVTTDAHGASGVIHGLVDIDATPPVVWKVLLDCAGAPKLMVNLKSCRILRQDRAGRWDEREQISRGGVLPGIRTVVHADYDAPSSVTFHSIAGDLKLLEGQWRLQPLDGGARTRVYYDSRVTAPFAAPGPLVRAVLRRDMPRTLANLRQACEAHPEAPQPEKHAPPA